MKVFIGILSFILVVALGVGAWLFVTGKIDLSQTVTVSFVTNSAHGQTAEDQKIKKGEPAVCPEIEDEDNMYVSGWAVDGQNENLWDFSQPVEKSMTLYAQWTPVAEEDLGVLTVRMVGGETNTFSFSVRKGRMLTAQNIVRTLQIQSGIPDVGFLTYEVYGEDGAPFAGAEMGDALYVRVEQQLDATAEAAWTFPKSEYFVGDEPDYTGLSVTITYAGGEETFTYAEDAGLFTLSVDTSQAYEERTVSVSFMGICTGRFTVRVQEIVVESVNPMLPSEEERSFYFLETPDFSKWVFVIRFNNGEEKTLDASQCELVSAPVFVEDGDYEYVFSAEGQTLRVPVKLYSRSPAEYFVFNEVGQSVRLVGLTPLGKTQRVIVVPDTYNGKKVMRVSDDVFAGNQTVRSVFLPASLTYLDEGTFRNCYALEEVGIADGTGTFPHKELPASFFEGCVALRTVSFWNQITAVGERCFYGCAAFAPDLSNLSSIGASAFEGCSSIESMTFDEYVDEVGARAFADISSAFTVVLSGTAFDLPEDVLEGTNVCSVLYDPITEADARNVTRFKSLPSVTFWLIRGDVPDNFLQGNRYVTQVRLGDGTRIGASAFEGCVVLEKVTFFADPFPEIGANAFAGCSRLSAWGDSDAFSSCSVGDGAFIGTAFASLRFSACTVGERAFAECLSLQSVTTEAENTFAAAAFAGCTSLTRAALAYEKAVPASLFEGCAALTDASAPAAESLGADFLSGTQVRTFTVGSALVSIDVNAFRGVRFSEIEVDEGNASFVVDGGILQSKDGSVLYKAQEKMPFSMLTFGDELKTVAPQVFDGVQGLNKIVFYGYHVPAFAEDWTGDWSGDIEANPFNTEAYREMLGDLVAPIPGDDYYCVTMDAAAGGKIVSYLVNPGDKVTERMCPTLYEVYYFIEDGVETEAVQFPFTPEGNVLLRVTSDYRVIDFNLEKDASLPDGYMNRVCNGQSFLLPTPTRGEFLFDGWVLADGSEITSVEYGDGSELDIYPVWRLRIEYNYESGASFVSTPVYDIAEGESFTVPALKRADWTFLHWTDQNGNVVEEVSFADYPEGVASLTAVWKDRRQVICYLPDGGTYSGTLPTWLSTGEQVQLPEVSRDGYEFKGWKMDNGVIVTSIGYGDLSDGAATILTASFWGTEGDPYLIGDAQDLLSVSVSPEHKYYYELLADIDLGEISFNAVSAFYGYFEGNGHTVRYSVTLGATEGAGGTLVGVFGNNYGRISNLNADATVVSASANHTTAEWTRVGGIAGANYGSILNCTVSGSIAVDRKDSDVGGIVGTSFGGTLSGNVSRIRSIRGNGNLGGIVGEAQATYITGCEVYNTVIGYYYIEANRCVGGFAGRIANGSRMELSTAYSVTVRYENPSSNSDSIKPRMGAMIGRVIDSATYHLAATNPTVDKGTLHSGGALWWYYNQAEYVGGNIGQAENSDIQ